MYGDGRGNRKGEEVAVFKPEEEEDVKQNVTQHRPPVNGIHGGSGK